MSAIAMEPKRPDGPGAEAAMPAVGVLETAEGQKVMAFLMDLNPAELSKVGITIDKMLRATTAIRRNVRTYSYTIMKKSDDIQTHDGKTITWKDLDPVAVLISQIDGPFQGSVSIHLHGRKLVESISKRELFRPDLGQALYDQITVEVDISQIPTQRQRIV